MNSGGTKIEKMKRQRTTTPERVYLIGRRHRSNPEWGIGHIFKTDDEHEARLKFDALWNAQFIGAPQSEGFIPVYDYCMVVADEYPNGKRKEVRPESAQ